MGTRRSRTCSHVSRRPQANGIAHNDGSLFVANTEKRQVVEVPIRSDGSPGPARVAATLGEPTAENPFAGVPDGLDVDACGNLYPLLIGECRLVRVSPDGGEIQTLATREDGLQTPTSLDFGSGEDAASVFIAEFAALAGALGMEPAPKVVKVDVELPGSDGR
ncbi:MAG: SMP-30/gluconolactonase/LRE family protein [Gemmatimonadota bacterium]